MTDRPLFCLAISEEVLGGSAPVLFQGGIERGIERAAGIGFDAVEIHIRNPSNIDFDSVQRASERHNVRIAAVGTGLEASLNGLLLTSEDPGIRLQTASRFRQHIDVAARFNATVFVGLCRGTAPDPSQRGMFLDRLAEALAPLAEHAHSRNVVLSLEPIAAYMTNLLNSTSETLQFLERPGLESVQLLLDTHHMFHEHENIPAVLRESRNRIAHLHISDSDRRYPGSGEINFDEVGAVLREIRYNCAISLETLPEPDGERAARIGKAWMVGAFGE